MTENLTWHFRLQGAAIVAFVHGAQEKWVTGNHCFIEFWDILGLGTVLEDKTTPRHNKFFHSFRFIKSAGSTYTKLISLSNEKLFYTLPSIKPSEMLVALVITQSQSNQDPFRQKSERDHRLS